jgi:hypothetical protein
LKETILTEEVAPRVEETATGRGLNVGDAVKIAIDENGFGVEVELGDVSRSEEKV